MDERIRGVVLAGGASTRFEDGDKALATLSGRPLLAHVVTALDAATGGSPVLAVADESSGRKYRDALTSDVRDRLDGEAVTDVPNLSGPLAGLYAAVDAVDAPWLFVCACDMPLVTPESVAALREVISEGEPRTDAPDAVVPVVGGHDQPLHALYRRTALEGVRESLVPGDALYALLDALDGVERLSADETDADLDRATTNVNTRADLAALTDALD